MRRSFDALTLRLASSFDAPARLFPGSSQLAISEIVVKTSAGVQERLRLSAPAGEGDRTL